MRHWNVSPKLNGLQTLMSLLPSLPSISSAFTQEMDGKQPSGPVFVMGFALE
jgi:hypothetical protein